MSGPSRQQILDQLREAQFHSWERGDRLLGEQLLARQPALATDDDAVLQLLSAEFLLREQAGDEVSLAEYERRFPQLGAALGRQLAMHRLLGDLSGEIVRPKLTTAGEANLVDPALVGSANATVELGARGRQLPIDASANSRVPFPQIDGYQVLRELGAGGMGVVYLAQHLRLQRVIALKMIRDQALASAKVRERFQTEAKAVARLTHPQIVQIYDYGEYQGLPFLSLEYVSGGSLDRRLNGQPQPIHESVALIEKLARAVAYAHRQGIIHRDLKPANILLAPPLTDSATSNGDQQPTSADDWTADEPKITDFGLAKCLGEDLNLTQSEALLGSCVYMSPEQAWGNSEQMGLATDIHALGVILYELLTGEPPYRDASLAGTLDRIRFEAAAPPSRRRAEIPAPLDAICLRCLAKKPGDRYVSADKLAEDLRRFLAGEATDRSAPSVARRKRLAAGLAFATLGIALAIWWLVSGQGQSAGPHSVVALGNRGQDSAKLATVRTHGERFAFLVGVRTYKLPGQTIDLQYTEADVDELSRALLRHAYERKNIHLLTQWSEADNLALAPTSANIRTQLKRLLLACVADDTVLLAVTGMGGDLGEGGMYCYLPADGRPDRQESLISLAEFYELLRDCPAKLKLLLIDTCQTVNRNNLPQPVLPEPPPGVAVLFACSPRESSYEHADLAHGVFSYHVLQAIKGDADRNGDGQLTLDELFGYTHDGVREFVGQKFVGVTQTPLLQSSVAGRTPVIDVQPD
ncbi:MAG: protein kinase [Pirellulales bacterium]|nr:protein kinase [Pirellulales bacterium]